MRAASRPTSVETVVVGAGQAGLLVSSLLRERGREHLVLDRRPTLGGGWQDRWDGFRLVSPNWTLSLADFAYRGPDPDGFAPRDEIVAHFRDWAAAMATPVELSTEVARLRSADGRGATRFRLDTNQGQIRARNVVVATGPFQWPTFRPSVGPSLARSTSSTSTSIEIRVPCRRAASSSSAAVSRGSSWPRSSWQPGER